MDRINVLIIEDLLIESEPLVKTLLANNYNVVGVATNFKDAIELFFKSKVDVLIIDIFLGGIPDGIAFAETINLIPNALKPFVFLSNSRDRQIFERAKLTRPFSFLMKPFNELEILYAIEIAVEKFYNQVNIFSNDEQSAVISEEYFYIKKNNSLKKVLVSTILYIKVEERYCKVITENESFMILISLIKISELLDSKIFIQTSRNTIVNTLKIIEIVLGDNLIILEGKHNVVLNDNYKDFTKKFNILK
jgi:two-component system LytT family response regulator